ncbi:hypothetical protein SDC9_110769 [bioreactor metagenome]|uniref:Uncharacterized protein n=1 Tax=bioreactor metagenome TaxID=1076179 RepID=A0A645BEK9_9ZZZZ
MPLFNVRVLRDTFFVTDVIAVSDLFSSSFTLAILNVGDSYVGFIALQNGFTK